MFHCAHVLYEYTGYQAKGQSLWNTMGELNVIHDSYMLTSTSLPFSIRLKDKRELSKQQAWQEVLLAKRDGELKHGGHTLVLDHTGKRWTLRIKQWIWGWRYYDKRIWKQCISIVNESYSVSKSAPVPVRLWRRWRGTERLEGWEWSMAGWGWRSARGCRLYEWSPSSGHSESWGSALCETCWQSV